MPNTRLNDGSVMPAHFTVSTMPTAQDFKTNNKALKVGMVIKIIYPDEPNSLTKEVIEYDVAVSEGDIHRGVNLTVFRNCKLSDKFGAPNNYEEFTLTPGKSDGEGAFENGSLVALECIDGVSDAGSVLILGGVSNVQEPRHKKEDGQFYDFLFNGIRYFINKDGELEIEFNSVIDVEGNKANEAAAGTKIKLDKEGRIKISDNEGQFWELDRVAKKSTWSNGSESIVIDKEGKKVELISSGEFSAQSKKETSIKSDGKATLSAKKDMEVKADSNMKIEAKTNMDQKSGGNWQVQATGMVSVKTGGTVMIQGGALAQIQGALTLLGAGAVPAAGAGISQCIGVGNLGFPVVSQVVTGSQTVLVGT